MLLSYIYGLLQAKTVTPTINPFKLIYVPQLKENVLIPVSYTNYWVIVVTVMLDEYTKTLRYIAAQDSLGYECKPHFNNVAVFIMNIEQKIEYDKLIAAKNKEIKQQENIPYK